MFRKLLIANRGEIAVRVIRACRRLGISPVAVYSDADRTAPHVLLADEAVPIGPAPAASSYLDIDALLEAARGAGAGAVHPGYGFLAENPALARRVEEAGLVFVGPSPEAIAAMGDKTEARERMRAAGVPVVPGSEGPVEDAAGARREALRIGLPVLLKAAAGGGGKGMRVVRDAEEVERAFESASREAAQAFGDGRVYIERFLERPRHIEIQVLADAHGNTTHLGERECSIQRRHQKLIEEAPSPVIDPDTRARMGEVAVEAARDVGYRNAGTVEFLFEEGTAREDDGPNGEFFFLEMNTRIQVEHPVTEMVTGVDLVAAQIRIAAGESLDAVLDGRDHGDNRVRLHGHAIECRLNAEDPLAGFVPSAGRIDALRLPDGPGVRWDGGIANGFEVGLHYDPLLAKLIVHGPDRETAIARMRAALQELCIGGLRTTQPFHLAVMDEPDFRAGCLSVGYVGEHPDLLGGPPASGGGERAIAAAAAVLLTEGGGSAGDGRPRGPADARVAPATRTRGGEHRGGAPGAILDRAPAGTRREGRSAWQRAFGPE